jgi:alkylation response protein AidB-like acyl-CoA dehydrogenase
MDFDLSPAQLDWQRRVRELCGREIGPRASEFDQKEEFPWPSVQALAKEKVLGLPFPKEYGGQGADLTSVCLVLEELGAVDSSVALTVESHIGLCSKHIFLAGNEEQKRKYLPRLTSGQELGAWALTEPMHGSDAAGIETTAKKAEGGWVINGTKTFTTQGSVAGVYVIFAKTEDGVSAFIVEKGTSGLEVGKKEKKMGLRASDTAQLNLTNLKVPASALCGRPGRAFVDAMKVLDGGRVAISGISIGMARGSLEAGLAYVKERKAQFGIGPDNPGLTWAQKILADLATEIEAARLMMLKAAWLADHGREYSMAASMSKLFSGELAIKAPTMVLDLFAEEGGRPDNLVQRLFRDAKLYQIGEGSTQVQELVISRWLLGDVKKKPQPVPAAA